MYPNVSKDKINSCHDIFLLCRSFLYVFFALSASIQGWKNCRPQVVVDGAFLKAAYGGTLISACTYNAEGKILPLAFAVVDSENNDSYIWFFERFREAFAYRPEMSIVSDRHDSIANAVEKVYPEAGHYNCIYHLLNNIKMKYRKNNEELKKFFFGAAKAYTQYTFEYNMQQLDQMDVRIRKYLDGVGREKWAALYAKDYRRQAMTSNIAESLNAKNNRARELPITPLLEALRALCQQWSNKFRTLAMNTVTPLTPKYHKIIFNRMLNAGDLKVILSHCLNNMLLANVIHAS